MASIYHLISALERGDVHRAWEYAGRVPRDRVTLDHALALVALLSHSGARRALPGRRRPLD